MMRDSKIIGRRTRRPSPEAYARPDAADAADAPRPGRAAHPRLQAPRYDDAVRGAGCEGRYRRRPVHGAPPRSRVPQVPRRDRAQRAGRARYPRHHGPRLQPQDEADPKLVRQAAASGIAISRRPRRHGSTRSSGSSRSCPISRSSAAPIAPPPNSKPPLPPTSTPAMPIQNPSAGQNPPMTSSPPSNGISSPHPRCQRTRWMETSESGH